MKRINVLEVGLALCSAVSLAGALRAGDIVGTVGVPKPDHVVIYVEKVPGTYPARGHAEMDQKSKTFIPYVLPVVQGTTVEFHNSDNLQHNVFGVGADEFNLGSYGLDASKDETFKGLGEVDILCNIHTEMAGYILVLQNPYFAQPDASGKYRIANVPPGEYVLKAWYEGKTKKQTVQVPAHGTVTASF
jgi:plastocyanin